MQWFSGKSQWKLLLRKLDTIFLVCKLESEVSYRPDLHTKSCCASKSLTQSASGEKKMWSFLKIWEITQKWRNSFCLNWMHQSSESSKIEAELKTTVGNTSEICHSIAGSFTAICGSTFALVSYVTSDASCTESVTLGNYRNLIKLLWSLTLQQLQHCFCTI